MAKLKIYADLENANIHFDGSTVKPQGLATCTAIAHPSQDQRITIKSTIARPNGSLRTFFKRMHKNRVLNKDGQQLTLAPFNYSRDQVVNYLVAEFAKTLASNEAEYKGVWDASTNTPDLTALPDPSNNGDFFWVTTGGTYLGTVYVAGDQIKYSTGTSTWDTIANMNASVQAVEDAALGQYDLYVDPSFTGIGAGTNIRPYNNLVDALAQSVEGDSILVKGENVITSEITLH